MKSPLLHEPEASAARGLSSLIKLHFRTIGIRIGEKVFAYDHESRTLGVRYQLKLHNQEHGWLFKDVSPKEWQKFCENPESASRLAYWYQRGKICTSQAILSFAGIWDCNEPQMPVPELPLQTQQKLAA